MIPFRECSLAFLAFVAATANAAMRLESLSLTASNAVQVSIAGSDTNLTHQLLGAPVLSSNFIWPVVAVSAVGVTSFQTPVLSNSSFFFRAAQAGALPWRLITALHPDDPVFVGVQVDDLQGGVDRTGTTDVTAKLQSALNAVASAGGGTLFLPRGKYRCDTNLTVPEGVCLRGEIVQTNPGPLTVATVLMAYAGKGDTNALPFITLRGSAAVDALAIWYPEQVVPSPLPFPPAIQVVPVAARDKHCSSVLNVTLVNAYDGVKIGPVNNALPLIRNLRGTVLKTGLWIDNCTDTTRFMQIEFQPAYWSASGLAGSPGETVVRNHTRSNATGAVFYRADNAFVSYLNLDGLQTGLQFEQSTNGEGGGAGYCGGIAYGITVTKAENAIVAHVTHMAGMIFNHSSFSGASAGLRTENLSGCLQFMDSSFSGGSNSVEAVLTPGTNVTAALSFQRCHFAQRALIEEGDASFADCDFDFNGEHARFSPGFDRALVLSCRFQGTPTIVSGGAGQLLTNHTAFEFPAIPVFDPPPAFSFAPVANQFFFAGPASGVTLDNPADDDAPPIQALLDAAAAFGGGIVFLPPGNYDLKSSLTVPSGVQLRGPLNFPHHSNINSDTPPRGTLLRIRFGEDDTNAAPALVMQPGSGAQGLGFYYPTQAIATNGVKFFPPLIQGRGENIRLRHLALCNPHTAVDLATYRCDGHVLQSVNGYPLRSGVRIGSGTRDGWLMNLHLIDHYWVQTDFPSAPTKTEARADGNAFAFPYKLLDCTNQTLFGCFAIGVNRGIVLDRQTGSGPQGISVLFGIDDAFACVSGMHNNGFSFLTTSLVGEDVAGSTYFEIPTNAVGDYIFHQFRALGNAKKLVELNGSNATLTLIQPRIRNSETNQLVNVSAGALDIRNAHIRYAVQMNLGETGPPANLYGNIFWRSITSSLATNQILVNSTNTPATAPPGIRLLDSFNLKQ
jgi:hypothetical protein